MVRQERLATIERALELLTGAHRSVKAFGVVIDKQTVAPADPVERAFEETCNRFNLFLSRPMDSAQAGANELGSSL